MNFIPKKIFFLFPLIEDVKCFVSVSLLPLPDIL